MTRFPTALTRALSADAAAGKLAEGLTRRLGPGERLGGAFLLSTAASGAHGVEVARGLARRWPAAALFGTTFEGVLAGGRTYRDEPALSVLGWPEGENEPLPFLLEPDLPDADRIADEILRQSERTALGPSDLVLLFPDALGSRDIEPILARLGSLLGQPWIAGSAASGVAGHPAAAFFGSEVEPGATLGLVVPGPDPGSKGPTLGPTPPRALPRIRSAGASRPASPWLEVTGGRPPWIDRLEGEPPLVWVRRQLGLREDAPVEPHLDRLLIRLQRREAVLAGDPDFDEWDVVGLDDRRGALSIPVRVERGDRIALALPDPDGARESLRSALSALPVTPLLLQFSCRARNEDLYGDPDLESAWVDHHWPGRQVLGTVAPFQLGSEEPGRCRLRVHSTLLVAVGEVDGVPEPSAVGPGPGKQRSAGGRPGSGPDGELALHGLIGSSI